VKKKILGTIIGLLALTILVIPFVAYATIQPPTVVGHATREDIMSTPKPIPSTNVVEPVDPSSKQEVGHATREDIMSTPKPIPSTNVVEPVDPSSKQEVGHATREDIMSTPKPIPSTNVVEPVPTNSRQEIYQELPLP